MAVAGQHKANNAHEKWSIFHALCRTWFICYLTPAYKPCFLCVMLTWRSHVHCVKSCEDGCSILESQLSSPIVQGEVTVACISKGSKMSSRSNKRALNGLFSGTQQCRINRSCYFKRGRPKLLFTFKREKSLSWFLFVWDLPSSLKATWQYCPSNCVFM